MTSYVEKQAVWNSLSQEDKAALRIISKLSDKLKYKIATVLLLATPDGIKYPPRFFQPIDHNEAIGIAFYMDIDACCSIVDSITNKIKVSCYLEAKTNNENNKFATWITTPETKNRRMQLEHIVDSNTRTFDMIVYAVHNVPENESILLHKLIIEKVYVKDKLENEKGEWIDLYNGYSFLDLLILLNKDKIGL